MEPDDILPSDELINWFLYNMEDEYTFEGEAANFSFTEVNIQDGKYLLNNIENSVVSNDIGIGQESNGVTCSSSSSKIINEDLLETNVDDEEMRLAKNSDTTSSKESRKRKREKVLELEKRLSSLQAENKALNAHLMNVTQRTTEVQRQRAEMERVMARHMEEIVDESSNQSELAAIVKQYTDIYADYGNYRKQEVSFHLQQLQRLLLPTKTTKMSLWTLQQDKSFFQGSKSSLFDILSKELLITPEQAKKIQQHRGRIKELLVQLKESLELIEQLKIAIDEKHSAFDIECGKIQSEVTPQQTVRFLLWISKSVDKIGNLIADFEKASGQASVGELVKNPDKNEV